MPLPQNSEICYVLMPFGRKANPFPGPREIDFDLVYNNLIAPAVQDAGLQPFRADQEMTSGLILPPMFERLMLCKYAIADLTTGNPNVYYEMGIRHAVRPWSTVLLYGNTTRLPFDIQDIKTQSYSIGGDGTLSHAADETAKLTALLKAIKQTTTSETVFQDSPLFALMGQQGYEGPDLTRLQARMHQTIESCLDLKQSISQVEPGQAGLVALKNIESRIFENANDNASELLEMLTAYRSREAWDQMVALIDKMPDQLKGTVTVQEQYGMALGRTGDFPQAEKVLTELIEKRGASALTYSFLGVVQKKRFLTARGNGNKPEAVAALDLALDAFMKGFKLDPRVIFTGINLVLLLEVGDAGETSRNDILPVVRYFINDAISSDKCGFWEHSAKLELSILDNDEHSATEALGRMLLDEHEQWMPFSTYTNLRMITDARKERGLETAWYEEIVGELESALKHP